jgi:uncharacterized protein (DUF1501 family)
VKGLFEDPLIVLGTEFGRTPSVERGSTVNVQNGRNHNSCGFSVVLAGGGIKDRAIDNRCYNHDLNDTILHRMGIDHTNPT